MLPYRGLAPTTLTVAQVEDFVRDGYLLVPDLFREITAVVAPLILGALGDIPTRPECWNDEHGYMLKDSPRTPEASRRFTPRYRGVLDDLCGAGRFVMPDGFLGYMPIRFPQLSATEWRPIGPHVDGNWFHHHIGSLEQGLVAVELWSDIDPEGGGTAIHVGSHHLVSRLLAEHEPTGLESDSLSRLAIAAAAHLPVVEATGRAGDVLFMHPHTLHGSSTNRSSRIRLAGNLCVRLHQNMRFDRPEGQLSPVEWSVAQGLATRETKASPSVARPA